MVTYFNDSSSGRPNTASAASGYTSETGQLQSTNRTNNIANYPRIVKAELKSYGTPAWSRTRSFGLERLAGNPPHRSVKEKGLVSSKSLPHSY